MNHNVPCSFATKVASTKSNIINITKATNTTCLISGFIITIFHILLLFLYYSLLLYCYSLYCYSIPSILCWLHWFLNRCALSHMTLISYIVGVASDYIVHMILTSYLVGEAYNCTVYHFECYNSSLLWETLCYTKHNTYTF